MANVNTGQTITDEAGGSPDYVRIRNQSLAPVSLSGVTLARKRHDNASDIYHFPDDRVLQPGDSHEYMVRIRYRQPLEKATLHMTTEGLYIEFDEPQKSIAAGQFAAWYDGDELVGSGVISA